MYWEMTEDIHNSIATSLFTRSRFNEVLKNLHLADNDNFHNKERLAKVHPLIEMVNKNFWSNYVSERHVSINESIVPYYGRHRCKQYMQSKPVKSGYKLSIAATTYGYGTQFCPYVGKDTSYDNKLGLGGSIVMSLSSKLPSVHNSNQHLVMSNIFTSPRLLKEQHMKRMAGTGAVWVNRTEKTPLKAV